MLSGIQHFAFCRRQWALIYVEQQWQENALTFGGRELHTRVDDPFLTEARGTVLVTRSLPLVSYELGFYGIADVVEFHRSEDGIKIKGRTGLWRPQPVEYKFGEPKIDDRDIVQLCAQGICLEGMFGITITRGDMYYGRTRHRQPVTFDSALRERVAELTFEMHRLFAEGVTPFPEQVKACNSCSLVEICMPRIHDRRSVRRYFEDALRELK